MRRFAVSASLATILATGSFVPAHANIISQFDTEFGTDFVTSGVGGLRGTGTGEISLSGISGSVSQAYLYWHGPTESSDPNFQSNIQLNGNSVSGTNIGFSDDNFWGLDNSQAYRADVTSLISGDGTYTVSGLSPSNSNGASLFAFFDDGDSSNDRDVVLFDGNDANFSNTFDPIGWDVTLPGINYSGGPAEIVLTVSDGQTFADAALVLNGTTIASSGAVFQGDTVPQNSGTSVTNGALWDIRSFDLTPFLTIGNNTINLTHGTNSDALSLINAAVNLPAGSAPEQPPSTSVPLPPTMALLALGLVSVSFLGTISRRRR